MNEDERILRVLELYSGIGGFHYALKECDLPAEVAVAIDINTNANDVYAYNFPSTQVLQRNIQSINAKDFEGFQPDLVWMSPPCQPFTRNGLRKDKMDHRTDSFLNVLDNLKLMSKKPNYILMENVKGFETSETHDLLLQILSECGYKLKEYLLHPKQIGIPNSRLRYYLLAELTELDLIASERFGESAINLTLSSFNESTENRKISEYLENKPEDYFEPFLIPDRILLKYSKAMDIVSSSDDHSCCFTKAYGHYATGTGSVLKSKEDVDMKAVFTQKYEHEKERLNALKTLRLRYFTPREVANLMGFPQTFEFPPNLTHRQCYQLLGNSLNIKIVSKLLQIISK